MNIPQEEILNNAGLFTAFTLSVMAGVRAFWLRVSKDKIILASDASDLGAINRLQKQVDDLDRRLAKEEASKRKMAAFLFRTMALLSACDCEGADTERIKLQAEFQDLMNELK